jgi:hypothetical protein
MWSKKGLALTKMTVTNKTLWKTMHPFVELSGIADRNNSGWESTSNYVPAK